ncbi:MAG: glycosyltransferase family 39 protein [Acidobacteriota bacterium]
MRIAESKHELILAALLVLVICQFIRSGVLVNGDGRFYYYPYVHSIVFDHDLDLSDEYKEVGLNHWYYETNTCTGVAPSVSPAGSPLLILPFYAFAHLGVRIAVWMGAGVRTDGYSFPYQLAYCLGSVLYLSAGLALLYCFLRRFFPKTEALFLTILAFLSTPLLYYVYHEPSASAGTGLFVGTAYFLFLSKAWPHLERGSVTRWALAGIIAGVGMMVRWEQVFYLLVAMALLAHLLLSSRIEMRRSLVAGAAFSGGFAAGFAPQMIIWTVMWGSPLTLPQGAEMHWSRPFIEETLFSSRNGLFSFTPIALVSVVGLLAALRRYRRLAALALACLASVVYMNSAYAEWWGAYGFGMRRVVALTAPLMAGCGVALQVVERQVARRPKIAVWAAVALLAGLNCLFFLQVKQGKLDLFANRSFRTLISDQLDMLLTRVGYPFSWPANWVFAARYDVSPDRYDTVVGNYLFSWDVHEQARAIRFGQRDDVYLGYGFSQPESLPTGESWRWSQWPRSEILVSLFRPYALDLTLRAMPFWPEGLPAQTVKVIVNGHAAETWVMSHQLRDYRVSLRPEWLRCGVNAIVFEYSHTHSPAAAGISGDPRDLAVQFRLLTFRLRDRP